MIPLPRNYATVKNPKTGQVKIGKVGFSWTSLIFGVLPSIFRNDWYNFICMICSDALFALIYATIAHQDVLIIAQQVGSFTRILWCLIYNLMYFRHLSNKGFVPTNERSRQLLVKNKYIKP